MYNFLNLRTPLLGIIGFICIPLCGKTETLLSVNKMQAIQMALQNNKSLIAARVTIERAEALHKQAGKWENPEVKLGYSSDWAFNNEGESSFEIGFEQSFPVTNKLSLLKDIAKVEIQLAEMEILNQERLLILEVENAITNVAYVEGQLKLRRSLTELNQEFAKFIESRVQAGEASSFEVNQIKIELYSLEQEIQQLENERNEYYSKFKRLLGLEIDEEVELKNALVMSDGFAALPHYTDAMLKEHPEYQLKELLHEVADKQVSLAMAERWGDIAVEIFFENERVVDEPEGIGTDRFFGIGVSIPLPLNNRYHGAIDESRAYRRQVKKEMNAVSLDIRSEAETLRIKTSALYTQAFHYRKNVTQLIDQNLVDMNAAYSSGQIGLTDLFRSQEKRLKIQSTYLSMVNAFEQAFANWKAVTASNLKQLYN